ncbi:YqeG family HAD IIIA-type phosphatase [Sporofaciens sp. SGI.106]|uniref:YqeG family HAD IIIA-type phosphatase n=1 Tax=Sporofaciens sp. SGI.106 TaxID=3420568 RepID=UPI003CFEDBF6
MFDVFFPDRYVASTYVIDFEELYEKGFRGLIFDIDNTLVPHGEPADERAIALFERLKKIGFHCCLISNNQEPRVKMFNESIQVDYVYNAHKPSTKNYKKAMEIMGTDVHNTVFIGDQLFTDVWGAKRTGIPSILVKPIHPKEEIQIVLKRYLEKIVLYFYKRSLKQQKKVEKRHHLL